MPQYLFIIPSNSDAYIWNFKLILIKLTTKQQKVSNNDTRSNFLNEQNQNCTRPQAFAKVTNHGFFKFNNWFNNINQYNKIIG